MSRSTCIIEQSNCGLTNKETVCAKCGLDTRVRYVSEEAALLAKAQAQARFYKSQLESDQKSEQSKVRAANGVPVIPVELTNKLAPVEAIQVLKDEQENDNSKLAIWHAQLASKIGHLGGGELNFELYKEHFLKEWMDCNYGIVYKRRFDALLEKYGPYFGVLIMLLFICTLIYKYNDGAMLFSFNNIYMTLIMIIAMLSIPILVITSIAALFSMKNFKQERQMAISEGYRKYINQVHGWI